MASIGGETASGDDIDIDFSDIVDNLDFTIMGTVGAQKGKWGFLADFVYLDIESGMNVPIEPGVSITNLELKAWIVTPMVTYRIMEEDQWTLDAMAGARYLYLKLPLDINYQRADSPSGDVWDGIVGARGQYKIDEKWYMPFHVDVGTGDTDLTWQAFAGVGYKYESFDLVAGYRYLKWDFDDGDTGGELFNDLTVDGPIIGAKFYF